MDSGYRSLLWYLLVGTRGGPNRERILRELQRSPHNANQLAQGLAMDYRTVRHHLKLLEQNGLVLRPVGKAYASPYELAPELAIHFEAIAEVLQRSSRGRRRIPRPESVDLPRVVT